MPVWPGANRNGQIWGWTKKPPPPLGKKFLKRFLGAVFRKEGVVTRSRSL
jgi:hypothetical protein